MSLFLWARLGWDLGYDSRFHCLLIRSFSAFFDLCARSFWPERLMQQHQSRMWPSGIICSIPWKHRQQQRFPMTSSWQSSRGRSQIWKRLPIVNGSGHCTRRYDTSELQSPQALSAVPTRSIAYGFITN
eukprot:2976870-Amphidinium_carterae.1